MRVTIFGGTGFIGTYLVDALIEAGLHPVLLIRRDSRDKVSQPDRCTIIYGEIDDEQAIDKALEQSDAAIYNIGILREFPRREISFEALHYQAARRTMDATLRNNVKRFLLMSANGVKAAGTPYQRTKYEAEAYLKTTSLDGTILRPSVLFGDPKGRMEFATQLLTDIVNSPLPAPNFYQGLLPGSHTPFKMAPVHVQDVANAFIACLQRPQTIGQTLTLCGPDDLSWREIISTIGQAAGKSKWLLPAPAWAVAALAAAFDRFERFPITRDQIQMLMQGNTCSEEGLRSLGIEPLAFSVSSLAYLNGLQTK